MGPKGVTKRSTSGKNRLESKWANIDESTWEDCGGWGSDGAPGLPGLVRWRCLGAGAVEEGRRVGLRAAEWLEAGPAGGGGTGCPSERNRR